MRRQAFANREPRKAGHAKAKGRRMPRYMFDAEKRVVPFDDSEVEVWLFVHGQTPSGKAWIFSTSGEARHAVYFPAALCDVGEPNGGVERWNARRERVLVPVCMVSMPRFKAIEKGLAK